MHHIYTRLVASTDLDHFSSGTISGIKKRVHKQDCFLQIVSTAERKIHRMSKIDVHHHVYPPAFAKGMSILPIPVELFCNTISMH